MIQKSALLSIMGLMGLTMVSSGCSTEIPLATAPPLYTQQKIQAIDHWDNIANDVAMRVQKSLEDRPDLVAKPIYIKPPTNRPFSTAFYNLLRTRLVSKGMQVADKPEPDMLTLDYTLQMVLHGTPHGTWLPSLGGMGIAVAGLVTGGYTTTSNHELMINSRIMHNNRYVMHLSHIVYINDDDWPLYISHESMDPMASTTRNVRITNK